MKFDSLNLGHVSDQFAVAPQLAPQDMETLRAMNYRSVIIVRPDNEAVGQPNHMQITDAARAAGLEARYLPCDAAKMGPSEVKAFAQNLDAMPEPIVAFCASGTRAMVLWALAMAGKKPAGEIIDLAMRAGHDISHIAPYLDAE